MKMKNWMRNAGFTLVELIVVIAVLGVLGAGAAVGYSGYTKKAAKSADQQLAAQIKYALEVAQVSDPMPNGAAALVLSKTGARVMPEATEDTTVAPAAQWVSNAMADAFGDNWKNELKLQYGEWGKGSAISASTLGYFGEVSNIANKGKTEGVKYDEGIASVVDGTAVPSFANDVDDLFVMIRDTAIAVNNGLNGTSGAKLIQDAANYTTVTKYKNADAFASQWNNEIWDGGKADYETKTDTLNIANAGIVKARNVALASYLRSNGVSEDFCKKVENYSWVEKRGIGIPRDAATVMMMTADQINALPQGDKEKAQAWVDAKNAATTENVSINNIVGMYFGKPVLDNKSQAYLDGLTYYTMMSTVNSVNTGAHSANDDTYWDEMAGAVGLYGSIARGEATLENLKAALENGAEGDVSVAVMAGQQGLVVKFSPLTIAP